MSRFASINGIVVSLAGRPDDRTVSSPCALTLTIQDYYGNQNTVILEPTTYVLNQAPIRQGDVIIVFYDTTASMPPASPPLCRAAAVVKPAYAQSACLDFFDQDLLSSDGLLKVELSNLTETRTQNGQLFDGTLGGRLLLVLFGSVTRSIPAQTTAESITVFCS